MFIEVSTIHPFVTNVVGQILFISTFGSIEPGKYKIELIGVFLETLSRPSQEINVDVELLKSSASLTANLDDIEGVSHSSKAENGT